MDLVHDRSFSTHFYMEESAFPVKMKPGRKTRFALIKLLGRRLADKPQVTIVVHFYGFYNAIGYFHQFITHAIHYSALYSIYFFPDELKIVIGTHIGRFYTLV
jgi:hypothetical protein